MIRLTIIIMLLMTLSSIAYPQSEEAMRRLQLIDEFVSHGLPVAYGTSDANIRSLGHVIKVDTTLFEAPHDKGLMLEERTYYFDGLQIVAHFVQGKNTDGAPLKAIVTSAKWKIAKGLRVGTSIDTVVKTLGEPTSKTSNSYEYCGETSVDCAIFEIKKNKVVKITFTYYLD